MVVPMLLVEDELTSPRRGWRASARFLSASLQTRPLRATVSPVALDLGDECLAADVYSPVQGTPQGTVLFVHGMSPKGCRDERQVHACRSLVAAGFEVVAPLFPDVAALKLTAKTGDRVRGCIETLATDRPIGIFSVSFSGGIALRAACAPSTADRVAAILLLGSSARPHDVLAHALAARDADPYVWWICFANWLPALVPGSEPVAQALREAVHDDSFSRSPGRFGLARDVLKPAHKELLARLQEPEERCALAMEALAAAPLEFLAPGVLLDDLRAPVALLHGASDSVVPAGESRWLHGQLRERGVESKLLITTLLGHGDQMFGPRQLLDVPALFSTFAWWFGRL